MRIVVYEKERKLFRTGGLPAPGREVIAGKSNGPRGCEDRRGFGVIGKALASGRTERRNGGLKSQAAFRSYAASESKTEATTDKDLTERPMQGRISHRSLDLFTSCRSRFPDVWRRVSPVARVEDSSRTRLDVPKAGAAGTRTKRNGHCPLAQPRLAANKKGAQNCGDPIVFLDESGFMLQPVCRRTWSPSGKTPIQYAWDRHDRLSAIGLIGVSPIRRHLSLYFQLLAENVDTIDTVWLLRQLHHHYRHKVVVVWDRWSVHRSAAAYFEAHHPTWFDFEWLPAYAPDLNPVEQCWNHAKYADLANFIPDDLNHLETAVTESFREQSQDQVLLRSFFAYSKLKL